MAIVKDKVGVVSCSGEDLPEGTISRIATRIVLEKLRPNDTVTICLPLFLAGSEDERAFARVFPTIAIDGCNKRCAEVGIKKYRGKPVATIVVSEIMQKYPYLKAKSRGKLSAKEKELALKVAEEIAAKVDEVLERKKRGDSN